MAEIKLNDGFSAQVEAFRAAGQNIDMNCANSVSTEGLSLTTVEAYQDRLDKIWRVMTWFRLLIQKDAKDMDALAAKLKAADGTGS